MKIIRWWKHLTHPFTYWAAIAIGSAFTLEYKSIGLSTDMVGLFLQHEQ